MSFQGINFLVIFFLVCDVFFSRMKYRMRVGCGFMNVTGEWKRPHQHSGFGLLDKTISHSWAVPCHVIVNCDMQSSMCKITKIKYFHGCQFSGKFTQIHCYSQQEQTLRNLYQVNMNSQVINEFT